MEFSKAIDIGGKTVSEDRPCFIVAEIGINHNGDIRLAKEEIDSAAAAGANGVKFQNYRTEDFISDSSLTYEYESEGRKVTESQYELFKRCELSRDALAELKTHCDVKGIIFHSTPTSEDGLADLVSIGTKLLKNGSDYLGHIPLIKAMGRTGLPTLVSTGMATREEIAAAVNAFWETGNRSLILLHCTSLHPTPPKHVNLRRIESLAREFGCLTGFSDHTNGITAAMGAVALGACWIEKHFTLNKKLPGPDHRFSSDPVEFRSLVSAIRMMETCVGDGRIDYGEAEADIRTHCGLSCVAARAMEAGEIIAERDIVFGRPGAGLPPAEAASLQGRKLRKAVGKGEMILLTYTD